MKILVIVVLAVLVSLPTLALAGIVSRFRQLSDSYTFSERQCSICRFAVGLVSYALKTNRGEDQVYRIARSFCILARIESPPVCTKVTKLFEHEIAKVLGNGVITPDQVCGIISRNKCGQFHNPMSDWEVDLNVSATLNKEDIANMLAIQRELKKPTKPYRFVHLSDVHVDLDYEVGSPAQCREPFCCRRTSTAVDQSNKAGYWGTYGTCDIPMRTFESVLKAINLTISKSNDIDYIVWTGDIQPHDIWNQTRAGARTTYKAVFEKMFEYLPNVRIFPTLGNHEMVPVDSFSPSNLLSVARDDSPEWLYRELDAYWSRWLPESTVPSITKDGFYAATIRTGLKLISLNTNFCHRFNFWLYINSTDPGNQLQWLVHELQLSELEHEQVHIIGHIPPGKDDCFKVWSKNFNRIVRRFQSTISGMFFGHTHNNEFEIFYDHDDISGEGYMQQPTNDLQTSARAAKEFDNNISRTNGNQSEPLDDEDDIPDSNVQEITLPKPIGVGFIGSSATTFVGLNPSFTIRSVNPALKYESTDYEVYYMNLTQANQAAEKQQPGWWSMGKFSQQFNIEQTSAEALHGLLVDMASAELPASHQSAAAANSVIEDAELDMAPNATWSSGPMARALQVTLEKPAGSESRMFKLYRMFHSFGDNYDLANFDTVSREGRRAFLCGFLGGQSHSTFICDYFIPKQ